MIEVQYIIAFSMAIVNLFKKYIPKEVVPIISIIVAVGLNLVNALIFSGNLLEAFKDGFISAGICIGMFTSGDAIRQQPKTPLKEKRN